MVLVWITIFALGLNYLFMRQYSSLSSTVTASFNSDYMDVFQLTLEMNQMGNVYGMRSVAAAVSQSGNTASQNLLDISKKRKYIMIKLAEQDPILFLNNVMSKEQKNAFPADVQSNIESHAKIQGRIEVLIQEHFDSEPEETFFVQSGLRRYELKIAGDTPHLTSGIALEAEGVALENMFVAESSALIFDIPDQAIDAPLLGERKLLVLLFNFLDSSPPKFTREEMHQMVFQKEVAEYFDENSYGKFSWTGDTYGWFTLPRHIQSGGSCQFGTIDLRDSDVQQFIVQEGIDLGQYEYVVLAGDNSCFRTQATLGRWNIDFNGTNYKLGITWFGSISNVGSQSANQQNSLAKHPFQWTVLDFLLAHELGHNLGIMHSNSMECGGRSMYGKGCVHLEYGNEFDAMGVGAGGLHYNAAQKQFLGWLDDSQMQIVTTPGIYTLSALEMQGEGTKLVRIKSQLRERYPLFLEYRKPIGFDSALADSIYSSNLDGIFINWRDFKTNIGSYYVDPTPKSKKIDYPITLKNKDKPFIDEGNGIKIDSVTPLPSGDISFRVQFVEPACVRGGLSPRGKKWGIIGVRGQTSFVGLPTFNLDSPACGDSIFDIEVKVPKGWDMRVQQPTDILISPGDIKWHYLFITPSSLSKPGHYTIMVNAIDQQTKKKHPLRSYRMQVLP